MVHSGISAPGAEFPPLGAAQLVTDSFVLLFRHAGLFFAIVLVPSVFLSAIQVLLLPSSFDPMGNDSLFVAGIVMSSALTLIVGLLVMGAVALAAYDTRLGRPVRIGAYLGRTLAAAPVLVLLGLALYLAFAIGLLFLILPGLYIAARYWVVGPAVLVERAGLSGLSRAARLSKGYRWPILGALILLFFLVVLIGVAVTVLFAAVLGTGIFNLPSEPNLTLMSLVQALASAIQYAIVSIFTALLYARLRELKEGLGMEDLVAVFE